MHVGETPAFDRARVAAEPLYNLATGAQILAGKWRATACVGDNQPTVVEDWYIATWAYNGLAAVNDPNNASYDALRGVCDPAAGCPMRPYQEQVWGWMEHPPSAAYWSALPAAYPALSDFSYDAAGRPLALPEPHCAGPTDCTSGAAEPRLGLPPATARPGRGTDSERGRGQRRRQRPGHAERLCLRARGGKTCRPAVHLAFGARARRATMPAMLAGFERRWVETVARALVPRGTLDGVTDDIDIGAAYDWELEHSPWYAALALRAALWMVWLAPVWRLGRLRGFAGLSVEDRAALLEELLDAKPYLVRMSVVLLKLTLLQAALGDERVLRRIGAYQPRVP